MSSPEFDAGSTAAPPAVSESGASVWVMRLLTVAATGIVGYLAWASLTTSPVIGCGGGSVFDCGHVLSSKWSKIGGIPVGVPAFVLYWILLSALIFCRLSSVAQIRQVCWNCITVCGISAGLAALWFIGLQVFVLEHLCPWCLAAHTCGLTICGLLLWKRPLGALRMTQLSGLASLGVAVLITGQLLTPAPQTYEVLRYDDVTDDTVDELVAAPSADLDDFAAEEFLPPAGDIFEPPGADTFEPPAAATAADLTSESDSREDSAGSDGGGSEPATTAATLLFLVRPQLSHLLHLLSVQDDSTEGTDDSESSTENAEADGTEPEQPERRLIGVTGNKFRLDIRQWPLLGPPDARYVFVEMFDYTCPHCRNTHRAVKGAFKRFGDDLAIIALPVPLDRKCNSAARSSGGTHRDSCEISRIAVGVWRIDPEKFHELHDWLFERSRTATSTRRRAEELVGKETLDKELNYPTAAEYISRHVLLYKRVGAGSVPKLMFPNSSMVGEVSSSSTLIRTIERELANR